MPILSITEQNYEEAVASSPVPVLLDFYATWCGPCRALAPIVQDIADSTPGVRVGKVDVDEQPALARRFGVMSIPTLVVLREGKVVRSVTGARPKQEILSLLFETEHV